jgi:hypothetical protein
MSNRYEWRDTSNPYGSRSFTAESDEAALEEVREWEAQYAYLNWRVFSLRANVNPHTLEGRTLIGRGVAA